MERGGLVRWLLLGAGIFFLLTFFDPFGNGDRAETQPPALHQALKVQEASGKPRVCKLWSDRVEATLSERGASLVSLKLLQHKYRKGGTPTDLVTTPDHPQYNPLHVNLRNLAAAPKQAADWQVDFDVLNWQLERYDAKSCDFSYQDEKVQLRKRIEVTGRPYELLATVDIKNTAQRPLTHALTVDTTDFHRDTEIENSMFRVNPLHTHVECVLEGGLADRRRVEDFEPKDFEDTEVFRRTPLNTGYWFESNGPGSVSAASNAYFTNALAAVQSPKGPPKCQVQIYELWDDVRYKSRSADPKAGALYRARLAYTPVVLPPGASVSYKVGGYLGPKERDSLAASGHDLQQLIDLGWFASIAKILVAFLLTVHSWVGNWGLAVIVLTVCARTLLFPLSIPSIKSMVKMRELKPEIDKLNEKFKDDPQAKGLAQMELWKKHKVNPLKGCLPQLAAMPVWFALYTTLQTAVELYNIPFLWFPDLSQPDPYYVLPFIIGAVYFVQQKMMPMQMDPAQQKMMTYFMPGMFTVFMLFLPAGLGVYMFTNSLLGIVQQHVVERYVKRTTGKGGDTPNQSIIDTTGEPVEPKASGTGKRRKGKAKGDKNDANLSPTASLTERKA